MSGCSSEPAPPDTAPICPATLTLDSRTDAATDAGSPAPRADGGASGTLRAGYVIDKLLVPKDATQGKKFGVDFDNNGTIDNAFGDLVWALAGVSQSFDIQSLIDTAVAKGTQLMLLSVDAPSLETAALATVTTWVGRDQPCASKDAACFSGSHVFERDARRPQPSVLRGSISGGKLTTEPGTLVMKFAWWRGVSTTLTLRDARLEGRIDAKGIRDGKLTGVITRAEIAHKLVPALAALFDLAMNDPATTPASRQDITWIFDRSGDGRVTIGDICDGVFFRTVLAGDVDVDKDGQNELSLGIGFHAVPARIRTP